MGYPIRQAQTAQPLVFLLVLSSDHVSPATGLSPTVTLSKNGAAFGSPAGAVAEIGSGWYRVAGDATDSGTLGPLILHATGTGADPTDDRYDVVAYDPQATSLGLVLAKTTNLTGFNDIAATTIVSGGAINTSSGAVVTVLDAGSSTLANASVMASGFTAVNGSLTTLSMYIDTEVASIKVVTDKLDTAVELDGSVYRLTANALELAPVSGGGSTDWTADERTAIRSILGVPASGTTPDEPSEGALANIQAGVDAIPQLLPDGFESMAITPEGAVMIDLDQTGFTVREMADVADADITVGDCLLGAVQAGAGEEVVAGTTYTKRTPAGTVIRTFQLDSASNPTSRT